MTALELQDKESHIGPEAIKKAIDNLTDDDFKVCNSCWSINVQKNALGHSHLKFCMIHI